MLEQQLQILAVLRRVNQHALVFAHLCQALLGKCVMYVLCPHMSSNFPRYCLSNNNSLSAGAIAGAVIGALIGLCLLICACVLIVMCYKKMKRERAFHNQRWQQQPAYGMPMQPQGQPWPPGYYQQYPPPPGPFQPPPPHRGSYQPPPPPPPPPQPGPSQPPPPSYTTSSANEENQQKY